MLRISYTFQVQILVAKKIAPEKNSPSSKATFGTQEKMGEIGKTPHLSLGGKPHHWPNNCTTGGLENIPNSFEVMWEAFQKKRYQLPPRTQSFASILSCVDLLGPPWNHPYLLPRNCHVISSNDHNSPKPLKKYLNHELHSLTWLLRVHPHLVENPLLGSSSRENGHLQNARLSSSWSAAAQLPPPKRTNVPWKLMVGSDAISYWGVSKNRGTPKLMVYNGKPYEQMDDLGGPPLFLETPIEIVPLGDQLVSFQGTNT